MSGFRASWQPARTAVQPFAAVAAPPTARLAAPPTTLPLAVRDIDSVERYVDISVPSVDLVSNGRSAKFLLDLREPAQPQVYFVNENFPGGGDETRFHYYFARAALDIPESLEQFNEVTYFSATKRYAAGVVHTYQLEGAADPLYALQFYPQDIVTGHGIAAVLEPLVGHLTIPGARLAFVPTGTQQDPTDVVADLATHHIETSSLDAVLGKITYLPLNLGQAWGYLRIFPADSTQLTPADIPVFDELPLDLSVVAGVITHAVQDSNSHVNLKSKERGTPNMVLRDAGPDHPRLAPWHDQPIHLTVAAGDFTIAASTEAEVAAKQAEHNSRPWMKLSWDDETRVLSFDELAAGTAGDALHASTRFGNKAANLGFLRHLDVLGRADLDGTPSRTAGYDLVPAGFGVPFTFYRNLVQHPANAALRTAIGDLVDAEEKGQSTADRIARLTAVQHLFLAATVPADDLAAVAAKLALVLPGVDKVKIRSSANAEDIANFDGAGLHDSFSASVSKSAGPDQLCRFDTDDEPGGAVKRKIKPKTIACAIRGVYASLWNQRAIEERSFARIDHSTAAMGLAVVGAYDEDSDVAANAVVITRVLNTSTVYGYSLSVQDGNNLVTNPDPGTWSETVVAAIGVGSEPTSLTITRFAKPSASAPVRTELVLPREKMLALVDIAATVERTYCTAKPSYYRAGQPGRSCGFVVVDVEKEASLDLEFKVLANDHLVCKQVREFGGR